MTTTQADPPGTWRSASAMIRALANGVVDEYQLIRTEQRDVVVSFVVAFGMNLALWAMRRAWFAVNPFSASFGALILVTNLVLALLFARKGHVFAQALSVTTVVAELLLIILAVRTGAIGTFR